MRTILTAEDLKRLLQTAFETNTEEIVLKDESGVETKADLYEYLNIHFYTWKNRLDELYDGARNYNEWVENISLSLGRGFALVTLTDSDVLASENIDMVGVTAQVTFVIQADKAPLLEYYCTKVRTKTAGVPFDFINSAGDKRKGFINTGILLYEEEPTMSQFGEVITCTMNATFGVLNDAATYMDEKVELSFSGLENTYTEFIYTKLSYKLGTVANAVAPTNRPDLTGQIVSSLFVGLTMTYYDYKDEFYNTLNHIVMSACALKVDNETKSVSNVNIPIYVKITSREHVYEYKMVLLNSEKVVTNGDYNVNAISLGIYGKTEGVG